MHNPAPAQGSVFRVCWLLPVAFLVHDLEELVTMPSWVAAHRAQLAALAGGVGLGEGAVDGLVLTVPALAVAMGLVLLVFVGVTWLVTRTRGRAPWLFVYALVLGGFFLHGFTHLGQVVYFGSYTPGSVTAALVVIPGSLYLYVRLAGARVLGRGRAMVGAVLGIALLAPVVVVALAIGRWVTSP